MIDTAISVHKLVAVTLWVLAAVVVGVSAVFSSLAFLGNVGLLIGIGAATATVRQWLGRLATLTRAVGTGSPRENMHRVH